MALGLSRWMPLINTPQIWSAPQDPCWVPLRSLGIRKRVSLAGLNNRNRLSQKSQWKRSGYSVGNSKRTLDIFFSDSTAHKYAIAPKNWSDQSFEGLGSQNKNNSWGIKYCAGASNWKTRVSHNHAGKTAPTVGKKPEKHISYDYFLASHYDRIILKTFLFVSLFSFFCLDCSVCPPRIFISVWKRIWIPLALKQKPISCLNHVRFIFSLNLILGNSCLLRKSCPSKCFFSSWSNQISCVWFRSRLYGENLSRVEGSLT